MQNEIEIITNDQPRPVIFEWELTSKEREDVRPSDDWAGFRYRGVVYGLGEFMRIENNKALEGWDGYSPETYFSGVLIKFSEDCDEITVGRYYS